MMKYRGGQPLPQFGRLRVRGDTSNSDVSRCTRPTEELVELATRGDTDAFNELVVRWERPIHALAYRVLGRDEEARDVCQEAFMRAFPRAQGVQRDRRSSLPGCIGSP